MRSYFAYAFAVVVLVVLTGACGFYWLEAGSNPHVASLNDGLWWALVTITTVGYGDIVPTTHGGRALGIVLMLAGIGTLGITTASIAAYLIKFDQFDALRIRRLRDHVIVCGLGQAGLLLAQAFRADGFRVLVIERDEANPRIPACRDAGAAVISGDASRPETLRRARLGHAKHLVLVCGGDGNNVEIAAQARSIPRRADGALSCSIQIRDPELWYALRTWELSSRDTFRLEFFNVSELGARAMLARYSPFASAIPSLRAERPHPLVVGVGPFSEHFIRHLARQWHDLDGASRPPLPVMLVDPLAASFLEQLQHRRPELRDIAAMTPHTMDLRSAQFNRAEFLFDAAGRPKVSHVYVCVDDEGLGLSTALLLLNHLRRFRVPIVVRMNRQAGLAALLQVVGAAGNRAFGEHLFVFTLLEEACQPDLVLRGTNEVLARALHQDYLARSSGRGDNPVAVPWEQLPIDIKESNREAADHIAARLDAIGCHIVPLTALETGGFTFTPDEIERLAVMEHDRWVAERQALGWKLGPRDMQSRTNPNIVPWNQLDEETRRANRDSVMQLPAFIERAGYTLRRYTV